MDKVEISVIIPVYNVEKYLSECLISVLNQEYENFEVICVNDGSADDSLKILQYFREKDKRIKIISQENQGLSGARNTGIENAKGDYILFLDSDDMLERYALGDLYKYAKESKTDFVNFDATVFFMNKDETDNNLIKYYVRNESYGILSGKDMFEKMIEKNEYCDSACLLFIRREWLKEKQLSFYPGILYEDCLFTTLCMMHADKVLHINHRYYKYRIREKSIMTSEKSSQNLYGRLVGYHYFNQLLYTKQFTEAQELALVEFTRTICWAMNTIIQELDSEEIDKLMQKPISAINRMELEHAGLNWTQMKERMTKNRFIEKISGAKSIEIYGAGVRGKRLLEYLRLNGCGDKLKVFVVTSSKNQPKEIFGVPVKSIEEGYQVDKDSLLIISFLGVDAIELKNKFVGLGYDNVEVMGKDENDVVCYGIRKLLKI